MWTIVYLIANHLIDQEAPHCLSQARRQCVSGLSHRYLKSLTCKRGTEYLRDLRSLSKWGVTNFKYLCLSGRAKHRTGLKYSTASLKYSTGCVNGVLWQC